MLYKQIKHITGICYKKWICALIMKNSNNIIGALANKGTSVFRETFQHSSKDVTHYFPSHMARGGNFGYH